MKQNYTIDCQCNHPTCTICGKKYYKLKSFDQIKTNLIEEYIIHNAVFFIHNIISDLTQINLQISKNIDDNRRRRNYRIIQMNLAYIDTRKKEIGESIFFKQIETTFMRDAGRHHIELSTNFSRSTDKIYNLSVAIRMLNNCYYSFSQLDPKYQKENKLIYYQFQPSAISER